ncbi:MAG: cell wall-binding repeat-containing protein [Clostridium sp.]
MKNKDYILKFIARFIIAIIFLNISVINIVDAGAIGVENSVELELKEIITRYGEENIILEDGIVIDVKEQVTVDKLPLEGITSWTSNNNDIVSIVDNKIVPNREGTTFLVAEKEDKTIVFEIFVSDKSNNPVSFKAVPRKGRYVVMIDPGHGGTDSGAVGYGLREKDIVLQISNKVKKQLEDLGVEVIMTRDSDVYLSLQERSTMANQLMPDTFISVHANAYNGRVSGIETFYNKNIDVNLAKGIQDLLIRNTNANNRGHKFGDYHVIRETTMSASLVETGFIDNQSDSAKLKDSNYQNVLASSIARGTLDYMERNIQLDPIDTERLAGADRFDTAIKVFEKGWDTAENVVLASGLDFPDALCATPLAAKLNAPILLVRNSSLNTIPNVLNAIVNKGVKNAYIVGGTGVIPQVVEDELRNKGINVKRLGGNDRYETSVVVAREMNSNTGEVAIANGLGFADGLSISSVAGIKKMPILLSRVDELPATVKQYYSDFNVNKGYIIGSTGVISDSVKNNTPNAERLGGADRYKTNELIFERFKGELNISNIYVSYSLDFADALSSSALAAKEGTFVLLSHNERVEPVVKNVIYRNRHMIKNAYILGSNRLISDIIIRGLGLY